MEVYRSQQTRGKERRWRRTISMCLRQRRRVNYSLLQLVELMSMMAMVRDVLVVIFC